MNSLVGPKLKIKADSALLTWLLAWLERLTFFLLPAKYLAYNSATKTVSCKGCLPAVVLDRKVNEFKLIVGSTFTPAPPLPPLLPIDAKAEKNYLCQGRSDAYAINQGSPDSFSAAVNHCSLSGGKAHFTLLIIYQELGETQPDRWFFFHSEAVNCRGQRVWWKPYPRSKGTRVDPLGKPVVT